MENTNIILHSKSYKQLVEKLRTQEADRIYCKHDLEHFVSMARILYIRALEEGLNISKDLIYTIGLLHDIGRVGNSGGGDHHLASAEMSEEILELTDYSKEEKTLIMDAILSHRSGLGGVLQNLVYEADKKSRLCFECSAKESCNWSEDKKNHVLKY